MILLFVHKERERDTHTCHTIGNNNWLDLRIIDLIGQTFIRLPSSCVGDKIAISLILVFTFPPLSPLFWHAHTDLILKINKEKARFYSQSKFDWFMQFNLEKLLCLNFARWRVGWCTRARSLNFEKDKQCRLVGGGGGAIEWSPLWLEIIRLKIIMSVIMKYHHFKFWLHSMKCHHHFNLNSASFRFASSSFHRPATKSTQFQCSTLLK